MNPESAFAMVACHCGRLTPMLPGTAQICTVCGGELRREAEPALPARSDADLLNSGKRLPERAA
jgi:rRNA maturation endonuclease Nob1